MFNRLRAPNEAVCMLTVMDNELERERATGGRGLLQRLRGPVSALVMTASVCMYVTTEDLAVVVTATIANVEPERIVELSRSILWSTLAAQR